MLKLSLHFPLVILRWDRIKYTGQKQLVTLDIISIYTNIGIDAGINSVKRAFDRYPESDRPDKKIIDLLELSLIKGNDFEFNGEMYQQVCGCAMGKRFSPNFASIYVAEWEEAAISKSSKSPPSRATQREMDPVLSELKKNCRSADRNK